MAEENLLKNEFLKIFPKKKKNLESNAIVQILA